MMGTTTAEGQTTTGKKPSALEMARALARDIGEEDEAIFHKAALLVEQIADAAQILYALRNDLLSYAPARRELDGVIARLAGK